LFLLVGLFPNSVGALPPDAAMPSVARMERSAIRDRLFDCDKAPDFAALHPGYDCVQILCLLMTAEQDPRMTATLSKGDLRTAALAKRDALSDEQRAAASQAMAKRGVPFTIEPGMVVSGYSPIRSEIDPAPLMRKLAEQGAKLALPAVMARGKSLAFRAWSPDDRLMMGPLGILEPSPAAAELIPDVMLVPLAAFDRQGHRIGYGAGHYDYTLAHLRKVKAITAVGTAFSVQEIKAVPALPHDVALDYVLTEKKVFDFRS
jgi:5-formyltetrahydrofolate cyclo-ligase